MFTFSFIPSTQYCDSSSKRISLDCCCFYLLGFFLITHMWGFFGKNKSQELWVLCDHVGSLTFPGQVIKRPTFHLSKHLCSAMLNFARILLQIVIKKTNGRFGHLDVVACFCLTDLQKVSPCIDDVARDSIFVIRFACLI